MKRRLEFDFGALSCLRITSIADIHVIFHHVQDAVSPNMICHLVLFPSILSFCVMVGRADEIISF